MDQQALALAQAKAHAQVQSQQIQMQGQVQGHNQTQNQAMQNLYSSTLQASNGGNHNVDNNQAASSTITWQTANMQQPFSFTANSTAQSSFLYNSSNNNWAAEGATAPATSTTTPTWNTSAHSAPAFTEGNINLKQNSHNTANSNVNLSGAISNNTAQNMSDAVFTVLGMREKVANSITDATSTEVPQSVAHPIYVNAKQYRRILKRREARTILEEYFRKKKEKRDEKEAHEHGNGNGKRSYTHESRHRHAMKRPRGPGGRFLRKNELEEYYSTHPEEALLAGYVCAKKDKKEGDTDKS